MPMLQNSSAFVRFLSAIFLLRIGMGTGCSCWSAKRNSIRGLFPHLLALRPVCCSRSKVKYRKARILIAISLILGSIASPAWGNPIFPLDFTTIRLGNHPRATLIIGGIQGDEPGGFSAATLLATRYEITEGAIVVVPNLNFPSIIRRSRGLYGDMNRKFARLESTDPEYATIQRIQQLIRQDDIHLVLNLHDGSGFYRNKWTDKLHNPSRWGQSIIIDQESMPESVFLGALGQEAALACANVNKALMQSDHAIHVHNTRTAEGDHEMEKSLSYYAVRQRKAAFGLEASKEFPVALRAYYHLLMIEQFLEMAGTRFHRDFELTPQGVEKALRENLGVSFAGNRIFLPLEDVRDSINYLPLPSGSAANAITSKPIMAVLPCASDQNQLCIHYGNRTITLIRPDWREPDESIDAVPILVDGEQRIAPFGQIINVRDVVQVCKLPGYRVNAIGYDKNVADESGLALRLKDFKERFSLDRGGTLYRVEVYNGKKFTGMFLLRFNKHNVQGNLAANQKNHGILPDFPAKQSASGY